MGRFRVLAVMAVVGMGLGGCANQASPSPEPRDAAATPSGEIDWKGDAEDALWNEWGALSADDWCANPTQANMTSSRVFRVTSNPAPAQGNFAYKAVVNEGDSCFQERAEMAQGLPTRNNFSDSRLFRDGDERWIAFQIQLSPGFNVNSGSGTHQTVHQMKQTTAFQSGSPNHTIWVNDGQWRVKMAGGTHDTAPKTVVNAAPAQTGVWVKWLLHVRFDNSSSGGFFRAYSDAPGGAGGDLVQVTNQTPRATMWTDPATGQGVPMHSRIGLYRNDANTGNVWVANDGYTVATTRAVAEDRAF